MWSAGIMNSTRNLTGNLNNPYGLFVARNGDIYVDNGNNGSVVKWTINTTNSIFVMNVTSRCFSLFIDINNTLYCSLDAEHQVISKSLTTNSTNASMIAGTGVSGSTSAMLNQPKGIFVDTNFNLYVADCGNNRVQQFPFGQSTGITQAGNGLSGAITLNCPTGITLDADGYLFIVDSNNNRIIGSGPNGFRCVVGCSNSSGSASDQLDYPQNLAFDNFGNLFVVDQNNSRIQKFFLIPGPCSKFIYILSNESHHKEKI